MEPAKRARIKELIAKFPEPWVILPPNIDRKARIACEKHPDWMKGQKVNVVILHYLSADLAELLVLLNEAATEEAALSQKGGFARAF